MLVRFEQRAQVKKLNQLWRKTLHITVFGEMVGERGVLLSASVLAGPVGAVHDACAWFLLGLTAPGDVCGARERGPAPGGACQGGRCAATFFVLFVTRVRALRLAHTHEANATVANA